MKATTRPAKKKVAVRKQKAPAAPRRRKIQEMVLNLTPEDIELMNAMDYACAKSVVAHFEQRTQEPK